MKRPYLFVVLFLVVFVFQVLVFIYVMSDYDKERRRFQVTEQTFVEAVERGVSNFLSRLSPDTGLVEDPTSPDVLQPEIVFVDEISTWVTYRGRNFCMIDGVTYTVGDYTPYGLVSRIVGNRVYCTSSNSVFIVRARPMARPSPATGRAVGAPDGSAL